MQTGGGGELAAADSCHEGDELIGVERFGLVVEAIQAGATDRPPRREQREPAAASASRETMALDDLRRLTRAGEGLSRNGCTDSTPSRGG